MWVERVIEGDRNKRMQARPGADVGGEGRARRSPKHGAWLLIAFATGGAWIMYFNDAPTVVAQHLHRPGQLDGLRLHRPVHRHDLSPGGLGARAGLHLHVPVAALPGARCSTSTRMLVTYEAWRGEPRGKAKAGSVAEGPRPLHRLRPVRARLPHRHRHPRRPAARMHRLRPLHRRLQQRDGQDGLAEGPHHLRFAVATRPAATRGEPERLHLLRPAHVDLCRAAARWS